MAARHLEVSRAIRTSLGTHPERGTLARLAEAVDVKPPTVTRWYKLESSPEPSLWAAIEDHLDLHTGALERAAGSETTSTGPSLDAVPAAAGQGHDDLQADLRALREDMDVLAKATVTSIREMQSRLVSVNRRLGRLASSGARPRRSSTVRQPSESR